MGWHHGYSPHVPVASPSQPSPLNPLLLCLLIVHLAFIARFRNMVTAIGLLTVVAPGMVGDILCRTLQELGPFWPSGYSL